MPRTGKGLSAEKKRFNAAVAERIEALRKQRGLSLRQLALKAEIGPPALTFLMQGSRGLPAQQLQKLAKVLGVSFEELVPGNPSSNIRVQVIGEISAGSMSPAEAITLETLDLPRSFAPTKEDVFGLRVRGESMEGAGILAGDIAIFRTGTFAPGHIVAATMDGGTALRRFVHDGTRFWLEPANPKFKPTEIYPSAEVKIWGVVVAIIRRLEFQQVPQPSSSR